jgi:hypothetical protein
VGPSPRFGVLQKHLDSNSIEHHDATVRTTVTLDADVEQMLKETMHRRRKGFKETLNQAIRAGLSGGKGSVARKSFKVEARPMRLKAGIDPTGLNKLADELEIESYLEHIRRPGRK